MRTFHSDMIDNHSILFRGNNAAPRIITAFIHAQAGSYLNNILGSHLSEVIRDPRLQGFSVASTLSDDQREQNLRHIQTISKSFLDAIVESTDAFPLYGLIHMVADVVGPCGRFFITLQHAQLRDFVVMQLPHM